KPRDRAVLHFLFDVRLSTRRRSRVGGGRPAGAGFSPGCHSGPHDSERRGAAARGRTQPCALFGHPQLHLVCRLLLEKKKTKIIKSTQPISDRRFSSTMNYIYEIM